MRERYQRLAESRRVTGVSILIAVALHAGVIALLAAARIRQAGSPPSVAGMGDAATGDARGLPATSRRHVHAFRVVDWETGRPIARARVTDVLGEQVVFTQANGVAVLTPRPSARLIVHVERPGYGLDARVHPNRDHRTQRHAVYLERIQIPYAVIDTLFIQYCNYCHGAVERTATVDLTSYDRVMASRWGDRPIVRPPNPDSSVLYRVLVDTVDRRGDRPIHRRRTAALPEFELELLAEWIRQGARPVGVVQQGVRAAP